MAVETEPDALEGASANELVVADEVAAAENETVDEPLLESQKLPKNPAVVAADAAAEEADDKKAVTQEASSGAAVPAEGKASTILQVVSSKEESNVAADLEDTERKALDGLRHLVKAALANNEFAPSPPLPSTPAPPVPVADAAALAEEVASKPVEIKAIGNPAGPTMEKSPKAMVKDPASHVKEEETEASVPVDEKAIPPVEDDGTKTVEAIEETVVPVATRPSAEAEASAAEATKSEKEELKTAAPPAAVPPPPPKVFIWGVPLLSDERSDTILLKFLCARDFKVKEAMAMLKNAVIWRKEFGIEALVEEDLGIPEMEKVVFMHGIDKVGHPVCYNVYGEFQNKELYAAAFANEEKRKRFLRWRIQYLEKGIRNLLDFKPTGVSTMVQVTDLKNSIGLAKKELRQALDLLQDNYPEFAAKQVFINVPWWYLAFNRMISPFFTQRTKSKFVFAGPSKSAETLLKYIAPEQVPVQFGGLSKENDPDFCTADGVTETTIKASMKQAIEIPITESCLVVWELRVLGWDVTYGAEFVPRAQDGYTVVVHKARKLVATDEPVMKGSFKIGEAGKVILKVDNTTSKKKLLLYRCKIKSSTNSV